MLLTRQSNRRCYAGRDDGARQAGSAQRRAGAGSPVADGRSRARTARAICLNFAATPRIYFSMTIACPRCGTLQQLPALRAGSKAVCRRCRTDLELTRGRSIAAGLACALTVWILLFPAYLLPLFTVQVAGLSLESRAPGGVFTLGRNGWDILSMAAFVTAFILPFVSFGLLILALGSLRLNRRPPWLGRCFRWALWLDPWAMPDVLLIGCAVAYGRFRSAIPVQVGSGGFCLAGASLMAMLSRATLDRRTVWRAIGSERSADDGPVLSCTACDLVMPVSAEGTPCPRCRLTLRRRKPHAMLYTLILLVVSILLYIPANALPMSRVHTIMGNQSHRIIDGVVDLFEHQLWPLGMLIFTTSMVFPALKLFVMAWCLWSVWRRSNRHLIFKTEIFRIVDEYGRWSNMDPFTIIAFVPLIQLGPIATAYSGNGTPAFIAMVVVTMLASLTFDTRLMWDAAHERR
jgi:paraquat-inducible protein A